MMDAHDAEKALLGVLINKPENISKVKQRLRAKDFSEARHRETYSAMLTMHARGADIDLVTLDAEVTRQGGKEATIFLVECTTMGISAAMLDSYLAIILEAAERRQMVNIANRIIERAAQADADVSVVINGAREALGKLHSEECGWVDMGEVLLDAYEDIEQRASGNITPCVSGLSNLDDFTGGFYPGEMTILAARPSVGKTAFGISIATASALKGHKVAVVSAEMIASQIGQRILADASGVNGMRLRTPKQIKDNEWARLTQGLSDWAVLPMTFLFSREIEEICTQTRLQHERGKCDMLIVDYIQLLTTRQNFEADRLRIGYISKQLKHLSTDLKIPVIALAQVARQNSGAASLPRLDSLKGSGNMEEDADNVILMHRAETKDDDALADDEKAAFDNITGKGCKLILLNVAKQRQGRTGITSAIFDPRYMRYAPFRES